MHWQYTPYTLPLIFGAAFAVSVGAYVWKRKFDTPGALPFIAVQLGAAAWSLGTALELASVEQSAKLIWIQVQYLGIVTIPILAAATPSAPNRRAHRHPPAGGHQRPAQPALR